MNRARPATLDKVWKLFKWPYKPLAADTFRFKKTRSKFFHTGCSTNVTFSYSRSVCMTFELQRRTYVVHESTIPEETKATFHRSSLLLTHFGHVTGHRVRGIQRLHVESIETLKHNSIMRITEGHESATQIRTD